MSAYDKQPREAGSAPSAANEDARDKFGPKGQKEHDRFLATLMEETAKVLKDLDAAGGHDEAHTDVQRAAMTALMRQRLVDRKTYKDGLVIYEITEAGRDYVRGLPS